jgi:hypothetical protein
MISKVTLSPPITSKMRDKFLNNVVKKPKFEKSNTSNSLKQVKGSPNKRTNSTDSLRLSLSPTLK